MDKCCVYELTFPNGKRYIGVTCDMKMRMYAHMHGNSLVGKACRKYGHPIVQILLIGEREYCYEMERCLIEQKQTFVPYGYNLMIGGPGNARHSEESIIKMRNALQGKTLTEEHKKKISEASKGRKHSSTTRLKMAQSQLGKKHSIETRRKISLAASKENLSFETRRKMSKAAKGKIVSTETRKKISNSLKALRVREKQANG